MRTSWGRRGRYPGSLCLPYCHSWVCHSRVCRLPGKFSGRESRLKWEAGQCCMSSGLAPKMGLHCSGPAPCSEEQIIYAEFLGYAPHCAKCATQVILVYSHELTQEAFTRTSPISQGFGEVTSLTCISTAGKWWGWGSEPEQPG